MNVRIWFSVLLTSTILLPATVTFAAIPNSRTIVSRLARNSGKGVFVIEQEVRFAGGLQPVTVKERWLVQNAENMRLIVQGTKPGEYRWDALYRDGKRMAPPLTEAPKEAKTSNAPIEFMEPLLFYRTSAKYFEFFVKNKILPPASLRERPKIGNLATYKPQPESSVRLSRTGGAITWAFGEPTPIDNSVAFPGAWIEQDAFFLRKVRLPSQAEMMLSEHASAGSGLKLPRERSIVWRSRDPNAAGPRSATIKVLSVKAMAEGSLAPQFQPSSIAPAEIKATKLPDDPAVHEFYSRFR